MTMTKTRGLAENTSRHATHIEYMTKPGTDVMGRRNIGGPTVDSYIDGVVYPNVQSAIDELQTLANTRIGQIFTAKERVSPAGVQQAEMLTFDGVVAGDAGGKAVVYVYGIPFIIDVGTNADTVCNIVLAKFEEMRDNNILFSMVERQAGTTTPILEVQFIDSATHVNIEDFNSSGIKVKREVTVPGVPGYGVWDYLGQETKTFTGGTATDPVVLHYFERIG
ncbi:baseplate wedge subunit [Aeromonas phage GomatiRiver_11]|nr:baseplate wedge protein [Aeromonas phage AhFM11]WKW84397.1 baseplate wedge subunit [Aeromonas phage GomatiRiver_11]